MRTLRRWLYGMLALGGAAGLGAWVVSAPRPIYLHTMPEFEQGGDPHRGKIVFDAGDCASCHASPGQEDRTRLGGGLALGSPFGTFNVPNISSDPTDGIGRWTTMDLANALLAGVSPEGQHYYPVFPYTTFAHMRLGDIRDLMAYLQSLPAVPGRAPPHDLPLLMSVRRELGLWKLLFFDQSPITPDVSRDPSWNRGQYLVEAIAHCGECHSSRNVMGAVKPSTRYAGAPDPEGAGIVPNITPFRIGHWSEGDMTAMLSTGMTPELRRVGSTMANVVRNTSLLPESDRDAIAAYTLSLPARPTPSDIASGER
jgi:mono/diheme cytochrome c family protein